EAVADLVSFLVWTADPSAGFRKTLGLFVIGFLCVLLVLTYLLKLNYWKDVH
ncbi:MAG: cytochrome c1, partial [Rhodocyclaceae bacterium]|nr:cytochrome c1 [Rhodocyclaceae bacterium]